MFPERCTMNFYNENRYKAMKKTMETMTVP